jgi:hypothetical protein
LRLDLATKRRHLKLPICRRDQPPGRFLQGARSHDGDADLPGIADLVGETCLLSWRDGARGDEDQVRPRLGRNEGWSHRSAVDVLGPHGLEMSTQQRQHLVDGRRRGAPAATDLFGADTDVDELERLVPGGARQFKRDGSRELGRDDRITV